MNATVNLTAVNARDQQTATYMIEQRNARIAEENVRRAAQTPPLPPLPLLEFGNANQIRTSYESLFVEAVLALHANYTADEAAANGPNRADFRVAFANATPAQRAAALTALTS